MRDMQAVIMTGGDYIINEGDSSASRNGEQEKEIERQPAKAADVL